MIIELYNNTLYDFCNEKKTIKYIVIINTNIRKLFLLKPYKTLLAIVEFTLLQAIPPYIYNFMRLSELNLINSILLPEEVQTLKCKKL